MCLSIDWLTSTTTPTRMSHLDLAKCYSQSATHKISTPTLPLIHMKLAYIGILPRSSQEMRACEFNHMCLWYHLTASVPHTWRSQDDPGIRESWLVPSVSINPRITLHPPECHVSDQRIKKCKRCRQRPPIHVSIIPLLHITTLLQRSIN